MAQRDAAKVTRWLDAYAKLVREPMWAKIDKGREECDAIAMNLLAALQHSADPESHIRAACDAAQDRILRLKNDVTMIAIAADEHELDQQMRPTLEGVEERVIGHIASASAKLPAKHEFQRAIDTEFARLQRGVVQYAKDARTRLARPLAPK